MMVMGKFTAKKIEPKTPQACESRVVPRPDQLTDLQANICDPQYPFPINSVKPELFRKHVENKYRFNVVLSGLYHQITPPVYPVVEFICWLWDTYDECWGMFLSAHRNKIFIISPKTIRKALCFPNSLNYVSFNEITLSHQFSNFPWRQQSDFIAAITNSHFTTLPTADLVPLTLFKEYIQPILALIVGLLGVEGFGRA